jgi:hypothetical protein
MSYAILAMVSGPMAFDRFVALLCQTLAVSRLEIQGTKFVDANPPTANWPPLVESANSAVFRPKLWVFRFLPGLRVTPPDAESQQQRTQPAQADLDDDFLTVQILAQE